VTARKPSLLLNFLRSVFLEKIKKIPPSRAVTTDDKINGHGDSS
jgi:hypothetical protein